MSDSSPTDREMNTPQAWAKFKDDIHDLYITQNRNLEGPQGVMALMAELHGFTRSKAQYTSQFRRWKFRKYNKDTTSEDWRVTNFKVSRAKQRGKRVQLYRDGKLVTEKILRTQGYFTGLQEMVFRASSPRTPPEFRLCIRSPLVTDEPCLPFTNVWDHLKSVFGQSTTENVNNFKITNTQAFETTLLSPQLSRSSMSVYFPESIGCPIGSPESALQKTELEHWAKFIAYVLSNNLPTSLSPWNKRRLLEILKEIDAIAILTSYPISQQAGFRALLEAIFRLAVEAEDMRTVELLLNSEVNLNGRVCSHPDIPPGSHITPVQLALLAGNLPLAKLLTQRKANLDEPHSGWKSSAIVLAIAGWRRRLKPHILDEDTDIEMQKQQDADIICQFIKFLITQGAKIDTRELGIHLKFDESHFEDYKAWLPSPLDQWQSPLTIVARYQLSELVDLFLDTEDLAHYPSVDEINLALNATLQHCIEWSSSPSGGGPANNDEPQSDEEEAILDTEIQVLDETPTFPFVTVSRLLKAGADANMDIVYDDIEDEVRMSPIEIAMHCSIWASQAIDTLLEHGAQPTAAAIRTAFRKQNYSLCFRLFSMNIETILYDDAFSALLNDMKPSEAKWLLQSLDRINDLGLVASILQVMFDNCKAPVLKEILESSECAVQLLSEDRGYGGIFEFSDILSVLSTMTIETLQRIYGDDLREFLKLWSGEATGLIHRSIINNNVPLAKFLIESGLGIDEVGEFDGIPETALCAAIRQRERGLFEMLLEKGARFEVEAGSCVCGHVRHVNALVPAVEYGDIELVRYLVSKGADLNTYGLSNPFQVGFPGLQYCLPAMFTGLGGNPCGCHCFTPMTAYLRRGGDWSYVLSLLELGARPNNPVESGKRQSHHISPLGALFFTHRFFDSDFKLLAAQALLDAGADPFDAVAIMSTETSPTSGYLALKLLLGKVIFSSKSSPHATIAGTAALIQAIRLMDPILTRAILDQRLAVDPTFPDVYPSPLVVALSYDLLNNAPETSHRIEIFLSLVQSGYTPSSSLLSWDKKRICLLDLAVGHYNVDILKAVLQAGTRMSPADYRVFKCPFFRTIVPGDRFNKNTYTKMMCLFDYGLRPVNSSTPIKDYLYNTPASVIKEQAVVETALQLASVAGSYTGVDTLLKNGVDVNAKGHARTGATALQFALLGSFCCISTLLIDHGADINAPPCSIQGDTCLQIVASRGDLIWVKTLVRKGAEVNAPPHPAKPNAATALQHAVKNGSLDMVRFLVEHGADVNQAAAPLRGATALQYAALYGFIAIAEFLIRHGAEIDTLPAEVEGRTALEGAAEHGRIDMVQLLLSQGAHRGEEHRQIIERACERADANGHFAIRDLIRGQV